MNKKLLYLSAILTLVLYSIHIIPSTIQTQFTMTEEIHNQEDKDVEIEAIASTDTQPTEEINNQEDPEIERHLVL